MADVRINIDPILRLSEIPRSVYRQWGVRWRGFALTRYTRASRGDGTWKRLSPSTIARRRKGKGPGPIAAILIDTGILVGALAASRKPGRLEEFLPNGIRVGYGGPAHHPSGRITIAGLARIHQEGRGVPQRRIVVEPPKKVVDDMAGDVVNYWKKVAD